MSTIERYKSRFPSLIKAFEEKNNYNITHTATELGISRASVYELIRKYGIKIKAF
ncbi:helix-turn-helix domain-containing protein [Candidatus Desulfofervidus auxilii]|uniref:helix-turn-helix domain-containing protein n=1 Tax=Desulfofervidus auxilii TaxID=1621989 RepID=UPI0012E81E0C